MGDGAMPELRDQYEDASEAGKLRIIELASTVGKPAPLLVQVFELASMDKSPAVRQSMAFHAGSFPSLANELAPILAPLLRDPVPEVRAAALSSLGAYPGTQHLHVREIARLTLDSSVAVASNAAAIAVRRPEMELQNAADQALPRLTAALQDPAPPSRAAAVFALGQYGKKAQAAAPALISLANREKVPEVKLQAAMALIRIGTPSARRTAMNVLRGFSKNKASPLSSTADNALKMFSEQP
jgi:HEAT repeat protein